VLREEQAREDEKLSLPRCDVSALAWRGEVINLAVPSTEPEPRPARKV